MIYLLKYLLTFIFIKTIISDNIGSNDEIHSLPGLAVQPKFRQYSGYLNSTDDKHFHYWFVESQSNPKSDPVILWLNGGPGCSSLIGFFTEVGPFRVSQNGKNLTYNEFSWNTNANMIFLESPAGTGFSYRDKNPKNISTNDEQTAEDNYAALLNFFVKFPEFKENKFYITGESYGGVYIPTLALQILRDKSKINLKGIAIGNGYLNLTLMENTRFQLAHSRGLIDTQTWDKMTTNCCSCNGNRQECDFMRAGTCHQSSTQTIFDITSGSGINAYSVYDKCYNVFNKYSLRYSPNLVNMALILNQNNFDFVENFTQNQYFDDNSKECITDSYVEYLNDDNVRAALHIPDKAQTFMGCNSNIFQTYKRFIDVKKEFVELLANYQLNPFIVYNGDADLVCDFMASQIFLDRLEIPIIEKYRIWSYNGKTGGFVKQYKGVTFMTFMGSGHMVPKESPGPALHMIDFLIGKIKSV